jgi:hypothetical protein
MNNITFNEKHQKHYVNEVILSSCIQQWSFIDWCALGRFSFIYNYIVYCKKVDFYNSGTFFRVALLCLRNVSECYMKNNFEDSVLLGYDAVSS